MLPALPASGAKTQLLRCLRFHQLCKHPCSSHKGTNKSRLCRSFSSSLLSSNAPKIILDGPSSSWFLPKTDHSIKDPISPTLKKPTWSEICAPRPALQKGIPASKDAIAMLRERYPYREVLKAIRENFHPREHTAAMDLRLAVRWLRRRFAYFHPESIFGLLAHCYRELVAAGMAYDNTLVTSRELVELLQTLLRRHPQVLVPHEVYKVALLDLTSQGDGTELIALAKTLSETHADRDLVVFTLKSVLQLWWQRGAEDASNFFLVEFMGKEMYRQIPISELALDIHAADFISFVQLLPQLFQPCITKDLLHLVKHKLLTEQLREAIVLHDQLLELDATRVRQYMSAGSNEIPEELLQKWEGKPISSTHVKAFFVFSPTQKQCQTFVTRINEELRQRLKARKPISSDIADVLLEKIGEAGYTLDTRLYSGLIVMFCRMGSMQQAEELLAAQCEAGLQPLNLTATMLMWGYSRSGSVEQGVAALQRLHQRGIRINIIHITQLIKLYSLNADGLPDVLNTIRYMENLRLCPDIVTFQVLIDAMIFFKRPDLLDSALEQMAQLGVACDIFLYTSLVIHFGREISKASLAYVLGRVSELGLDLTPEYVTHALLSSKRCKISLEYLEAKLGPSLASQHRRAPLQLIPAYIQFINAIASDRIELRRTVVRFLEAWAPSPSPNDYPYLIPLIDCLVHCIRESQDAHLLSLLWYAHARHFPSHSGASTDVSLLPETHQAFEWALSRIRDPQLPGLPSSRAGESDDVS